MRIASGDTSRRIYFVAVDATDFSTRETGLTATSPTFAVYRSRDGGIPVAMTTPTIQEVNLLSSPNSAMDGVYTLLLDEDMTITAGVDSEEMCFHITHPSMAPVTRTIELYRPKITTGNTLSVESDGDLTKVNTLDGHTAQTGDSYARLGAPAGASVSADIAAVKSDTASILTDTDTTIPGLIATAQADLDTITGSDGVTLATAQGNYAPAKAGDNMGTVSAVTGGINTGAGTITTLDGLDTAQDSQHSATQSAISNLNNISTAQVNAEVDTAIADYFGTAGNSLTAIPWNSAWDAEVQSEVTDALNAYDPPTKAELDAVESNIRGADSDTLKTLSDQIDGISAGSSPQLLQNTTIATLDTQTSFTLTAGSEDNDAYNGGVAIITDQSTSTQKSFVSISDYVGSTKTVTLSQAPAFTIATGDTIDIIAAASDAPTAAAIRAEIDSNSTQLAAIVADTNELQTDWADGGRLDLILDATATASALATVDNNVDAILADTADMQPKLGTPSASISADIAAIKSDTAAILIDTNELQGDWTNGGRLDLILDAILADTGTDGVVLTTAERNAIADAILDRDMSTGADSGSSTVRTVRQALRFSRNKVTISGGTLTVTKEDDSTASWTASVTTSSGDPITSIDPAGP